MKTLILDNDEDNLNILRNYLKPLSEFDISRNIEDGIELFKTGLTDKVTYDLIIINEVFGIEIIETIRNSESYAGLTDKNQARIIIVSSAGESGGIRDAYKKGCNAFLIKPILKLKLAKIMEYLNLIHPKSERGEMRKNQKSEENDRKGINL